MTTDTITITKNKTTRFSASIFVTLTELSRPGDRVKNCRAGPTVGNVPKKQKILTVIIMLKTREIQCSTPQHSTEKKNKFNKNTLPQPAITCSKLTIKHGHWRRYGVFNVTFEHISHFVLVFLLLTLSR